MDQELLEADKLTSVELKCKQLIKEAFNSEHFCIFKKKYTNKNNGIVRHNRNALCM